MYMRDNLSELLIALLLIVTAFIFVNPYWMPMGWIATILCIFGALFVAYVIFIWREKKGDEREIYLRNIAGRIGYLASAFVLVLGIIFEVLKHNMVNKWLIAALVAMIVAKILGFVWAKRKY
ncbi:MAG: hypothetical protein COV34_02755 [Candidatus Zambryskibacteria bacterium CG10_big_fil_rev_8_21_14_0_10_42_12]|uniref:Uncharacterized protein n=1 Tax=Candidatus Zambryskibacteria bacterium CG10_big_fil_rev_8_21_14_0_10_42_12 TaxID=1975115 RepID=A0A2H0QUN0_9BACT|nr:MAG: hypothetical protein COV34_02755 [Candidatus Zambryskibacteria bacterium CG10_big_fil_rev_8_21_14_0_10_42_12]